LQDTITFGADCFEFPGESRVDPTAEIPLGIGRSSTIKKAILDKNVRIGNNVRLVNSARIVEASREAEGFCIRDGIICVLKGSTIPHNFAL
jgi:glucose-1-phosphate adenylyltransferase